MQITVISPSKEKKALIDASANFYAQELNLNRSKYSLSIHTVPGFLKEHKFRGAIVKQDCCTLSMALDSRLDIETMLQTLAHEMVHAKQYALGQLDVRMHRGRTKFFWLGKHRIEDYYDAPWEIEAFSKERNLANKIAKILVANSGK